MSVLFAKDKSIVQAIRADGMHPHGELIAPSKTSPPFSSPLQILPEFAIACVKTKSSGWHSWLSALLSGLQLVPAEFLSQQVSPVASQYPHSHATQTVIVPLVVQADPMGQASQGFELQLPSRSMYVPSGHGVGGAVGGNVVGGATNIGCSVGGDVGG